MIKKDLEKLFETDLAYLYNMEIHFSKLLSKVSECVNSDEIKQFSKQHIEDNKNHVDRIAEIFNILGEKIRGKKSLGMIGLVNECSEIMDKCKKSDSKILEISLLASLQRVKHYQIGAYETLTNYSNQLKPDKINELLKKNLIEEKNLNNKLKKMIINLTKTKS